MSDVESVRAAKDIGHKSRWGLKHMVYRSDGKKLTISKRKLVLISASVFAFSSGLALFMPQSSNVADLIPMAEVSQTHQTYEIPETSPKPQARGRVRTGTGVKLSGLELVKSETNGSVVPGTTVGAKLLLNASNGLVRAQLTQDLVSRGEVIASSGSTLIGSGNSTEDRLMIQFTKLIDTNDVVQNIAAQACDASDQSIGLKGSRISRYGGGLAAGLGLNFASGLAQGLQQTEVQNGVATKKSDLKNAALNGAATTSLEHSKNLMEKWKEQKAQIQVPAGSPICIVFTGD